MNKRTTKNSNKKWQLAPLNEQDFEDIRKAVILALIRSGDTEEIPQMSMMMVRSVLDELDAIDSKWEYIDDKKLKRDTIKSHQ